jgi:hypothetical protein
MVLNKFKTLFLGLRELQSNLSFSQTAMQQAQEKVLEKQQESWNLDEDQKKEQPGIIAKRLRVACRHIAQAGRKKNPPKWYTELFGSARVLDDGEGEDNEEESDEGEGPEDEGDEEQSDEEEFHEEPAPVPTTKKQQKPKKAHVSEASKKQEAITSEASASGGGEWAYWGWDPELEGAWRSKALSGRDGRKEATTNIVEPDSPAPHKFMLAKFVDGKTYELSDLTVADWKLRCDAKADAKKATKGSNEPLWARDHETSGLQVTIRPRVDRQPLVSLYLGTSQCCQVPLSAFKNLEAAVCFLKVIFISKPPPPKGTLAATTIEG